MRERQRIRLIASKMEPECGCRRHKRQAEADYLMRRTWYEQVNALTDADPDWLYEMGWRGAR